MLRRDFIRTVISVGLAPKLLLSQQRATEAPPPPAPVPWTLGLNPKTPLPLTEVDDEVAATEASFFTQAQMDTFVHLCNVLLPPIGGRPGAVEAGTPLFLDFLIGSSPKGRQRVYTGGLNWLDRESQSRYEVPFARLSDVQADALLKPWLRTWMTDHPPMELHADFVNIAHEDIRTATANSKAWSDAALAAEQDWVTGGLYWSPIEPDVYCESSTCARRFSQNVAAPKAAHTLASYPR